MIDWLIRHSAFRTVKKFLSSRLIMNSRRLWNSHQRHKFLRAEASRTFWKIESQKWCFQRFLRGIFHRGRQVVSSEYTQDWEQCRRNVPGVPRHRTVWTFYRSKPVRICAQCHSKLANGCRTILFDGAYFLLAVMLEGDQGSRLKRTN